MTGVNCSINFENNPERVVYANDMLYGNVHLRLSESKTVRSVYIKFHGEARTEWYKKERDHHENRTKRRYFRGHVEYMSQKIFLVNKDGGVIQLDRGDYIYNFQLRLPAQLPSSFEGEYGHIRYIATVVLDIPAWPDDEFEQPFTVIKPLNLNEIANLRNPITVREEHNYYPCFLLCCFPSDPVTIYAKIPVGGYAAGQTINLSLNVDNQSNTRITDFTMELIKWITYYAEGEMKYQSISTLGRKSTRGVEIHQKRIINIDLDVPAYPPTDETTRSIIKIRYYIRVTGSGTYCSDPELLIPIIIGTRPLDDFVQTEPSSNGNAPSASIVPSAPPMDEKNNDSSPPYPNDELPTYEEASNSKGSTGNNYKPKYPMFRRQTSYSLRDD